MHAPDGARFLAGLRKAEEAIEGSIINPDDAVAWAALLDGLAWLYRSDERERRHQGPAYYATRSASPEGQILAGLIYFRGEVEHSAQTDAYTVGLVKAEMWRKENGQWRNTGTIREMEARVFPRCTPPREGIPMAAMRCIEPTCRARRSASRSRRLDHSSNPADRARR